MNKEISAAEAAEMRTTDPEVVFLDVREPDELAICHIEGARHIPMGEIPERYGDLPREQPLVVLCHHGMRSANVIRFLESKGFTNAINLRGGIDAWSLDVDPDVPRYG